MLFLTILFLPFFPIIPLPFYALELFVGVIQALIFSFLTIVFAGIATSDHEASPAVSN
jgi:F0F1-type ATP synthase membrane subunit a